MTTPGVPRLFLPLVLRGCVDRAKENGVEEITAEQMQILHNKRAEEKKKQSPPRDASAPRFLKRGAFFARE